MRRLKDKEHGAVAVTVALLMVVVLGMAAIVIDLGMVYAERAQLQNGADAAALAIAQDCAANKPCDMAAAKSTATQFADLNTDGEDVAAVATLLFADRTVAVQTSSTVQHWFAPIIGVNSTGVGAAASASWEKPSGPLPIVFAQCDLDDTNTTTPQTIEFHKKDGCLDGPPAAKGKLDQAPNECRANVDPFSPAISDGGNQDLANCDDLLSAWIELIEKGTHPIGLVPLYSDVQKHGKTYNLSGFAAFELHGWNVKFGSSGKDLLSFRSTCGNEVCIVGKFLKYVPLSEANTWISDPSSSVKLTK